MTRKNYYYISQTPKAREINDLLKAAEVGRGGAAAEILAPWLQD